MLGTIKSGEKIMKISLKGKTAIVTGVVSPTLQIQIKKALILLGNHQRNRAETDSRVAMNLSSRLNRFLISSQKNKQLQCHFSLC
jgi:hypothetical protein